MSDWRSQLKAPKRLNRWTDHAMGTPSEVRLKILSREAKFIRNGPRAGQTFEVLTAEDVDTGTVWDVPALRTMLAAIVEEHDPQPGDVLGLAFSGQDGQTYMYAGAVLERASCPSP